jgi:amidase
MHRREFLKAGILAGAAAMTDLSFSAESRPSSAQLPEPFELDEKTSRELQQAMESGSETAASITHKYIERIHSVDRLLVKSVVEVNPEAEAIAAALDEERKAKGPRGPLHGIPILIKDNIDTADQMKTTAGSLALSENIALHDSFVAAQLRKAGAVILGKTNLSEWANFRSTHSSSGWSGRGGQTHCPYALDRNPSGSSSGTGAAVSSSFCAIGIGTETDGSIVSPSNNNGIVGIKPTVGLVGRTGIIPISISQDTAGPMARTVTDAAILLGALAGQDPGDPYASAKGKYLSDYTPFLDPAGLKGARIGVARKFFGFSDAVDGVMKDALDLMKAQGAILVDPADIPSLGKFDDAENETLLYEFKVGLAAYLGGCSIKVFSRSLKDLIAYNDAHGNAEMPYFGQELFHQAEAKGPLTDPKYLAALKKKRLLSRAKGIDQVMDQHKLDVLVAPSGGPAWTTDLINGDHFSGGSSSPAAVAGYPNINVPAGMVNGLPVGISFFGRAWSESVLIRIAFAFEQHANARQAPKFYPTLPLNM